MKMNKFRANLHQAFFNKPSGMGYQNGELFNEGSYGEELDTPDTGALMSEVTVEAKKVEVQTKAQDELGNLKEGIQGNTEISNMAKEAKNMPDSNQKQKQKFETRSNATNEQNEKYSTVWEKKINEGYGHLISALEENHYFDGKNKEEEILRIKGLYLKEVKKQYKENIFDAKDRKFDEVKDIIFGRESKDYPANKIYTELTGATIFRVERQYTSGYETDILGDSESNEDELVDTESEIDKKNRKFLSNDLPEYLWDIRKTPRILNVMKRLPIFSVKVDRPSKVDRDAISDFLKAANRIPTKDGKSPAMVLIESLHDNTLNTNSTIDTYVDVLEKHGMDKDALVNRGYKQFRKCISKVMEVGNFYINTQKANNNVKNQHAIYLSVLGIIENSKGAENAVNRFKEIVEQAKSDKKTEKKEGYKKGENLDSEFKALAEKLGITNLTRATRLSELAKNNPNYFKNTSIENILANLNNDNVIDARDTMAGGLKTGAQFLEICKQVGEDKAIDNLLKRAQLLNTTLGLGLDASKFTKEEIQNGNKGLILLLQNIISNPGEDLYTLLSEVEGGKKGPLEGIDLKEKEKEGKIKEEAFKKAGEILNEKAFLEDYKDQFKGQNVEIQSFADLQASLASYLYDNYKFGLGVGSTLSFNEWARGLQIGAGAQVRDDGCVLGLNISYDHDFYVGKGWTLTPGVSAGIFLPIISGDVKTFASVGLNLTADKKKINLDTGKVRHYGPDAGYNVLRNTAYLGWHDEWNKAEGVEEAAKFQSEKFEKTIMWKLLDDIKATAEDGKLDLSNPKVRQAIEKLVNEQKDIKEEDKKNVVDGMLTMLAPYNNVNLNQAGVKYAIAEGVAQKYGRQWAEKRKEAISQNIYRSGYSIGAFRVVASQLVGIYAGLKRTDHDLDGYGDRWGKRHGIDNHERTENGVRDVTSLENLNKRLGLTEGQGLLFSKNGDEILVPKSILNRVKVSESMKKLLVKNTNGDISISPRTTMSESIVAGTATQSRELLVGEGNSASIPLDTVKDDRFAQDIKEVNKAILTKENVEHFYTKDGIINGINKLKAETKSVVLNRYNPTQGDIDRLIVQLNALQNKDKIAKIIIERQSDGTFEMEAQEGVNEGKGLDLEYRARLEMFDSKAKELADKVYERAASLKDPTALNRVKHPLNQPHPEYEEFINQLGLKGNAKNIEGAKSTIINIINNLNKKYPNSQLNIADGDWPTDSKALEQALLSINNVFARSIKVKGNGTVERNGVKYNQYEFTTNMGDIVREREGQIGGTLRERIKGSEEVKYAYANLMKAMGEHRKNNVSEFNTKSASSVHLDNAVGFNLGDKYNPENPLLNPEIYDKQVDLDDILEDSDRNVLHRRAIENFINQPALFKSIKDALGVGDDAVVKIKEGSEFTLDEEGKQTLELDIGGEIIKLGSDMKFGYFTQCVNHTVILENIKLTDDRGKVINFTSGTWDNGKYIEGNKTSIVSTTTVGMSVSVIVHNGKKTDGPDEDPGEDTTIPEVDGEGPVKPDNDTGSEPGNGEIGGDLTIPVVDGGEIGGDDTTTGDDGENIGGDDTIVDTGGKNGGDAPIIDDDEDF